MPYVERKNNMKRPKYKTFKKQKDLIKQAIKNTIHRCDIIKLQRIKMVKEKIQEKFKEKNWLAWAQKKLGG